MLATGDRERWALRLALPMLAAVIVLTPIARSFIWLTELVLRPFGIKHAHQSSSPKKTSARWSTSAPSSA